MTPSGDSRNRNLLIMSKIRIKKRYGRLHRLFLFSSNQVKGSTLRPTYSEEFHLRIDPESPGGLGGPGSTNGAAIPLQDTEDVTAILDDVKEKVYNITQFAIHRLISLV